MAQLWHFLLILSALFTGQRTSPASSSIISAAILPHHDLVQAQRQQFLQQLATQLKQAPLTVIVVSPNHYGAGQAAIQTTEQIWQLQAGDMQPAITVIHSLEGDGVANEPASFKDEHGIYAILPDIRQVFPQANVVPLIVKSTTTPAQIDQLKSSLMRTCADCLLVASVDFSHYQPALLAEQHDEVSIAALEALAETTIWQRAEVDSPPTLALLLQWARAHHTEHFTIKDHTNSGVLLHDPDIETTTHVMGWYEAGEPVTPEPSVNFVMGGDVMFGRLIAHRFLPIGLRTTVQNLGERLFWGTDGGVVNLEGPISDQPVPDNISTDNLTFNFPPQAIEALRALKVSHVSLANNHSANAGQAGLAITKQLLQQATIQPIGGPGAEDWSNMGVISGQGMTLYIIGVHALIPVPDLSAKIKELKQDPTHRVIIFPHWGIEYATQHTTQQAQIAHAWIEAGADAVIGSHPHVIQDMEVYQGKPIIYSLGNLLFDQTFSLPTQQGLLIAGQFTADGLKLFALPTESVNLKPQLMRGPRKQIILEQLYQSAVQYRQNTPAGDILFFPK